METSTAAPDEAGTMLDTFCISRCRVPAQAQKIALKPIRCRIELAIALLHLVSDVSSNNELDRSIHTWIARLPFSNVCLHLLEITLECIFQWLSPHAPHILTTGALLILDSLFTIVILDSLLTIMLLPIPRPHAYPEILPMIRALPEATISIYVHELTSEGLAKKRIIEG